MTWEFHLNNGQRGIKEITDPLIDNEEIARQRASAEFLNGGYKKRFINLKTHRTDLHIGDIINVNGLNYEITSISLQYNGPVISTSITGIRYE